MALTLGDNFSYQGSKPLDARLKYDTLATMKAVGDATMYEGCLAYCVETDKTYQWKSTNTVDADTGRWREYESGGGGHAIEDSTGTTLTQRETLQFGEGLLAEDDDTNEKTVVTPDVFQEGDIDDVVDILPSGGRVVATGFTPIGTIIPVMGVHAPKNFLICDGTVYNIADYPELASYFEREFDESNHFGGDGTTTFAVPDLRGEFIRGAGTNSHSGQGSGAEVGEHQDATEIPDLITRKNYLITLVSAVETQNNSVLKKDSAVSLPSANGVGYNNAISGSAYTSTLSSIAYTTRPTNTSVLFCIAIKDIYTNPINDYSTEEKVVGSWLDGSTIYQKTISCGQVPQAVTSGTRVNKEVAHGVTNIDRVVNLVGSCFATASSHVCPPIMPVQMAMNNTNTPGINIRIDATNIYIVNSNTAYNGITDVYVTIQYTKS